MRLNCYAKLEKQKNHALEVRMQERGWKIVYYGDEAGNRKLASVGLSDFSKDIKSFAFRSNTSKVIAIDSRMPAKNRRHALAHEIGHIDLKHDLAHLTSGDEKDAERFARLICTDGTIFKRIAIYLFCILCLGFGIYGSVCIAATDDPNIQQIDVSASPAVNADEVVHFTASGEKYHRPYCSAIKGRSSFATSIEDAEKNGLEPCQMCHPDIN